MTKGKFRVELDSMGEVMVTRDSYTARKRAVENFPISGVRFPSRFMRALELIKFSAAGCNQELGLLSAR
jgi:fumarate hydratase, class II